MFEQMLQVAIYTVYVVVHLRYGIGHFLIVHRCAGSLLLHRSSVVGGRGLTNLALILEGKYVNVYQSQM